MHFFIDVGSSVQNDTLHCPFCPPPLLPLPLPFPPPSPPPPPHSHPLPLLSSVQRSSATRCSTVAPRGREEWEGGREEGEGWWGGRRSPSRLPAEAWLLEHSHSSPPLQRPAQWRQSGTTPPPCMGEAGAQRRPHRKTGEESCTRVVVLSVGRSSCGACSLVVRCREPIVRSL